MVAGGYKFLFETNSRLLIASCNVKFDLDLSESASAKSNKSRQLLKILIRTVKHIRNKKKYIHCKNSHYYIWE